MTLVLDGPLAAEDGDLNPFMDYQLHFEFRQVESGETWRGPGYFAAAGNAAHTWQRQGIVGEPICRRSTWAIGLVELIFGRGVVWPFSTIHRQENRSRVWTEYLAHSRSPNRTRLDEIFAARGVCGMSAATICSLPEPENIF